MIRIVAVALLGGLAFVARADAASFDTSTISSPANGSELFYDGDTGSGSITVTGSVSAPQAGAHGRLVCYFADDSQFVYVVPNDTTGVPVTSGTFDFTVSLAGVSGDVCRLALVPFNHEPPTGAAAAPYQGPSISVSHQQSFSATGNLYNFDVLTGTLPWSFEFRSLGGCPVFGSFSTDPTSLGSFWLFAGNACLPQRSGVAPSYNSRSALQIDSLNAYPPAAISSLASEPGFVPLRYSAVFDSSHDTVTISDNEFPVVCGAPGGFPPTASSCPMLRASGIEIQQTTTLLPGGQVARVAQRFVSVDGQAHTIDALFSQAVQPPAAGGVPGFEFPGQSAYAAHGPPDAIEAFPSGPGSIIVIGNENSVPATSDPLGAITYSLPPASANFVPGPINAATGVPLTEFLMHYADTVPANGSIEYDWSFSQAATWSALSSLERVERDRFSTPSVTITSPASSSFTNSGRLTIRGIAMDPVGIAAVTVDGIGVPVLAGNAFSTTINLKPGANVVTVTAVNEAGNTSSRSINVTYTPRCVVPALRGKTLAAARTALRKANCELGRVRRVKNRHVRAGRVISSKPGRGANRAAGTKVSLEMTPKPKPKPKSKGKAKHA